MVTGTSEAAAPIGIFDSGLGGLSVLQSLRAQLPHEDFIYVADSGYCPYGGRTAAEITARAVAISDFLLGQGAKQIVVACNTATIAAVEQLRASYSISFVGMEPAVKPAVAATRSGVVGVLATGAALAGEKLLRLIDVHAGAVRIITQPCPGLVEQVEAGALDTPQTIALLRRYLEPLLAAGADTLVLGCTHYPFLRAAIAAITGPEVALIESGAAVARRSASLLAREGLNRMTSRPGDIRWFTSGDPAQLSAVGTQLWRAPIKALSLPVASGVVS
jgi:glutamate racemase